MFRIILVFVLVSFFTIKVTRHLRGEGTVSYEFEVGEAVKVLTMKGVRDATIKSDGKRGSVIVEFKGGKIRSVNRHQLYKK